MQLGTAWAGLGATSQDSLTGDVKIRCDMTGVSLSPLWLSSSLRDSKHNDIFKGVSNLCIKCIKGGEMHSTSIIIVSHFNDFKLSITND